MEVQGIYTLVLESEQQQKDLEGSSESRQTFVTDDVFHRSQKSEISKFTVRYVIRNAP